MHQDFAIKCKHLKPGIRQHQPSAYLAERLQIHEVGNKRVNMVRNIAIQRECLKLEIRQQHPEKLILLKALGPIRWAANESTWSRSMQPILIAFREGRTWARNPQAQAFTHALERIYSCSQGPATASEQHHSHQLPGPYASLPLLTVRCPEDAHEPGCCGAAGSCQWPGSH